MGGCISVANASYIRRTSLVNPITDDDLMPQTPKQPRTPKYVRPIRVIKDSAGKDIFKRYRFGRELGRGEFGVTYECQSTETGEKVACKKISKSKLRAEIDVEDVRREVEIMRHLPVHPKHRGELFDRIVAKGHYTERAAAIVIKTILEVVKVCHKHGVIHRDLKPENFLYANKGETAPLKAIDFGLSIFIEPGVRFKEIVGSPYYMAPEVLRRNYAEEVDVWSAGVILYILLCGVPPFWAETEEGIAQAIIKGDINYRRDPWPRVSEDAKNLVKSMLNPNPYERLTVEEALGNHWILNAHKVPNIPLGEHVRSRIQQFSLMNKFKKKVISVVAENLPDEQVTGLKQMFQEMDKDNNGSLTFEELKDGLCSIGDQPLDDPDVQMLMEAVNELNGTHRPTLMKTGCLNCDEFMMIAVHLKRISDDDHLRQAFHHFDKNNNGYIEFDELKECLFEEHQSSHNEKMVQDIIHDADLDKDGRISYPEFAAMMTTGMDWKMASRQYSRVMLNAISVKMFKDQSTKKA
ncbi:hypothetical protein OSB04_010033 [Centaurea solstitialis]|uniref:non-specific serine/threonine protein kinase n=1 Tax=Centaurea solstitialis TaxID=347529 RepID=A0AA38T6R8_9ASTR|nr:hypothetical protein OSB04_010033 [Centaurea solstitialis]